MYGTYVHTLSVIIIGTMWIAVASTSLSAFGIYGTLCLFIVLAVLVMLIERSPVAANAYSRG